MMVLMALVTTFMTGPVINMIEFFFKSKDKEQRTLKTGFNTLLSFGSPQSGSRLLELAHYLNLKNEKDASVTALHFSPSADVSIIEAEQYEKEDFMPISQTASRLKVSLKKVFGVTDHVEKEIVEIAKENPYDVVLVGSSRDLFTRDKTGGKVKSFVHQMDSPVGIFIDGGFQKIDHAAIILSSAADIFLLKYGKRFLEADKRNRLALIDLGGVSVVQEVHGLKFGNNLYLIKNVPEGKQDFYKQFHILIISSDFWKNLMRKQHVWLNRMPSVLIINK
jgi:hypothetical protein